jgi:hypothetical protein
MALKKAAGGGNAALDGGNYHRARRFPPKSNVI